jgi:hypothetical protein
MQGVSEKLNDVGAYLKDNPSVLASLLAGGGAGVLGGALTAMEKPQEGEDPSERRKRILRNALISAGGGAAAGGLATKGYNLLNEVVPGDPPPTAGDEAKDFGLSALLTAGKSALGFAGGKAVGNVAETFNPTGMQQVADEFARRGIRPSMFKLKNLREFKNWYPNHPNIKFPVSKALGRIGALLPLAYDLMQKPFVPEASHINDIK